MKNATLPMVIVVGCAIPVCGAPGDQPGQIKDMQHIEGGTFQMGDVFGEAVRLAEPVHEVTLAGFYLDKYEVTVEEFTAFVDDSGYVTSAERGDRREGRPKPDSSSGRPGHLASGGAWLLDRSGESWGADANWKNPHFEQAGNHPVTCLSWTDAAAYCNWLSGKGGLPPAYDLATGDLLDRNGEVTTDVTRVQGYRLPTEAEWEYAARERGKRVRFGNGRDKARSGEMNFDAGDSGFPYSEKGEYRGRTVPVGSFKPNALGLSDLSGNVWEWCSDFVGRYPSERQTNPYQTKGVMGPRRAARGGPWVGDASWARVATRIGWTSEDRCNNIGFRIARSE